MARSAALNPASMPFFPGSGRGEDLDSGAGGVVFSHTMFRDTTRSPMSSVSISPSEYRSVKSSPSPPQERRDIFRHQPSPGPTSEGLQPPPAFRQLDSARTYSAIEPKLVREGTMVGKLDTLPEGEDSPDTPSPTVLESRATIQTSGELLFMQPQDESAVAPNYTGSSSLPGGTFSSSSPDSSLDSASQFTSSGNNQMQQSFDAQLRASPLMRDVLDRLRRYEYSTLEIQRDLGEMHRKVNLLVERALGASAQPEFKDPFASSNGHSFSLPPVNKPRPSIGNIAPNQAVPSDDMSSISQRLNTLTSSVGQLLALQTQQLQSTISDRSSVITLSPPQQDIAPNQILSPSALSNATVLGLSGRADSRPSPRQPNPPMRTWSAGTLDIPLRPPEQGLGRPPPLDKRRSVSGLLRRESSGFSENGDLWAGGSPRDGSPMISKWDQLSLAPELLRSLTKFGVGPPNKIQQRALPFLLRGADIIAQAPPTQERIAAYVIPAIQTAVTNMSPRTPNRGPLVIMVSTTVDQATQAQRMIRDLGGPIGVRSALGVGAANNDLTQELRLLQQNMPHIICGTPQKLHALFTTPGGLLGSEVRFLVLDEVDQLIARNLHEFVFNIVKLLPPPRSRPLGATSSITSPSLTPFTTPFDTNVGGSTFQNQGRRFSTVISSTNSADSNGSGAPQGIERQTALFSNTVPQDVLNLATAIQLREPVRVLVRRDGNVTNPETTQGSRGLRQFYLYLAFTAGGRSDPMAAPPGGGLGIIGSGRGASSAETAQAREWKLDALADLFDDVEVNQAIVHVGGMTALDSVVYKLASRGLEAVPLHGDMNAGTKLAALSKFRTSTPTIVRQSVAKVLVVYDVQVKPPDVTHIPLIINYDLPKAVEEYAHRVSPAIASNYSRAGVVVNFVTATGGDVEMLRSIECFYKIKCPEVPMSLRDVV